jgi:hypothetical protein
VSRKISITIDDDISDLLAMALVHRVTIDGRQSSKYTEKDCYAYASNINDKYWVYADLTKKGNDTFKVLLR